MSERRRRRWWSLRLGKQTFGAAFLVRIPGRGEHVGGTLEPVGGHVLLLRLVMGDVGRVVQMDEERVGVRFQVQVEAEHLQASGELLVA